MSGGFVFNLIIAILGTASAMFMISKGEDIIFFMLLMCVNCGWIGWFSGKFWGNR